MKLRYVGPTFYNGFGLTNGKIYTCTGIFAKDGLFNIIDDEGEEYAYPIKDPKPLNNETGAGKWEIIEDKDGELQKAITEALK